MRRIVTLILALAVTACSNTHGQPLEFPGNEPAPAFFVERHDGDGRDLASTIAGAMRSRGMDATSGTPDLRPADVDFLVTYEDRWNWDLRMYLTGLRIEVRDPTSNRIVAFGYSFQDSLAALGKDQLDVVNRALDEMLPAR
jgi:hypothetical protein